MKNKKCQYVSHTDIFYFLPVSLLQQPHPGTIITLTLIFNKLHFLFINHPLISAFWHRI